MFELLSSRKVYRNPRGGITERCEEHFESRTVEIKTARGIIRSLIIPSDVLGINATRGEIVSVVEDMLNEGK